MNHHTSFASCRLLCTLGAIAFLSVAAVGQQLIKTSPPVGANALAPIHTASADGGVEYGVWAAGPDYKISFHDGATFVPMLGKHYPHNQSLHWRTVSAKVGELELVQQDPLLTTDVMRAEYDLGAIVEAYDILGEGVEQTFVLAARRSAGDLVIRGAVQTQLSTATVVAQAAHRSLEFVDGDGLHVLTYGAVTAIDAVGRSQPMTTSFVDGQITLRLDGAWLASATYPVVVDPLLGAGDNLIDAAEGGEVDIVTPGRGGPAPIWAAFVRYASAVDGDVWMHRWEADGTLGNAVYSDVTNNWSTRGPSVAFVEAADRVVVTFDRFFPFSAQRFLRMHRHYRADLNLSTAWDAIATGGPAWRSDVGGTNHAGAGSDALVVWQQEPGSIFVPSINSDLFGCYVNMFSGAATAPFPLSADPQLDEERPTVNQVAADSTQPSWCAAYQASPNSTTTGDLQWNVAARRVDSTGLVTPPTYVALTPGEHHMAPRIEGTFDRYLVAFTKSTTIEQPGLPTGSNGHEIHTVRLDWDPIDPFGTQPWGSETLLSTPDPRLEIGSLACDRDTDSHWGLLLRSTVTEHVYLRTLGYRGQLLQSETVVNPVGADTSVVGGIAWDEQADELVMAYGINGGANYITVDRFVFPSAAPFALSGAACTAASLHWLGSQRIGSERNYLRVSGAPVGAWHIAVVGTATTSVPLTNVVPFENGCFLLVPASGPDFLGLLPVGWDSTYYWNIPLPENLDSSTLYFQVFHTPNNVDFTLRGTQRLALPIVK